MDCKPTRLIPLLAASLLLAACAGTLANVQHGAQTALHNTLAFHFNRRFADAVGTVIRGLAMEGGYLDNPLVRILLPPPVGLVIDVARDLHHDPRAALLETLMNRAAEHAVPVAGPVLQAVLRDMDKTHPQGLFAAGKTATTEYLREKAGGAVQDALLPVVAAKLAENGAVAVYEQLLADEGIAALVTDTPESMVTPVSPGNLDRYVTEMAVDGLFKTLAQHEVQVRESVNRLAMPIAP
jgi:hypothetical protein